MRIILALVLAFTIFSLSYSKDDDKFWVGKNYQNFRVFPRMDRANNYYKKGKYVESLDLVNKVIDIDSKYLDAYKLKYEILTKLKRTESLRLLSVDVQKEFPSNYIGFYYEFQYWIKKGSDKHVVKSGERVLSFGGIDTQTSEYIVTNLIASYVKVGDYKSQDRLLSSLGKSKGVVKDDSYYRTLITAKLYMKDFKGAAVLFDNAKEENYVATEADLHLWINILGNYQQYSKAYKVSELLFYSENNVLIKVNLLEKLGKYEQAADLLYSIQSLKKHDKKYWIQLSNLYQKSHNVSKQIEVLDKGIKSIDDDFELYQILSERLISLKRYKHAIPVLKKKLRVKNDKKTREQLALMYLYEKQYKNAIKQSKKIIQSAYNKEQYIPYLRTLVSKLEKNRQWRSIDEVYAFVISQNIPLDSMRLSSFFSIEDIDEKIEILEKDYPYESTPQMYRFQFMYALYKLYKMNENRDDYERVMADMVELNLLKKDNMLTLANSSYEDGNYEKTTYILYRYLENYEENSHIDQFLGYCYQNLGKSGLAIHFFEKALASREVNGHKSDIAMNLVYLYEEVGMHYKSIGVWNIVSADNTNLSNMLGAHISLNAEDSSKFKFWISKVDTATLTNDENVTFLSLQSQYYDKMSIGDSAIYLKKEVADIAPSSFTLLDLGYCAERYEKFRLADSSYYAAYKMDNSLDLNLTFSNLYFKMGRYQRAYKGYKKELTGNLLDDYVIKTKLAQASIETGRYSYADKQMSDIIKYFKKYEDMSDTINIQSVSKLKRSKRYITKDWYIHFNEIFDVFGENINAVSPAINVGNNGFGNVEAGYYLSYKDYIPLKSLAVQTRLLWNNDAFKPLLETTQIGVGVKYKPVKNIPIGVFAEYLVGVGDSVDNNVLLNINNSLFNGIDRKVLVDRYLFKSMYNDFTFFALNQIFYVTSKLEVGYVKQFDTKVDFSFAPYVAIGGNYNNDRVEGYGHLIYGGLGLSLLSWHNETREYSHSIRNRISSEFRMDQTDLEKLKFVFLLKYEGNF